MIVKYNTFGSIDNNCYLIVNEKTNNSALVDCTDDSQKMYDLIGNTNLKYILLTHGHFDHIGGVGAISKKFGAKVVISALDAPMLSSSKLSLAAFCNGVHNNAKADITVADGDIITLDDINIKVMATPGHTKGSVCYIVDDMIFSGDTVFYASYGRTDFPSGSDIDMANSLKKISLLNGNYKIYTGHNDFTTLDFERKHNPLMR